MVKKDKRAVNSKRRKAASKKPVIIEPATAMRSVDSEILKSLHKTNKQKPSNLQNFKKYISNNKLKTLLFALALTFIAVWSVNQIIIAYEQNQFNKVEAAMDAFTAQIQPILGEDVKIIKNKSCGYRSVKFEDSGQPSCGISYAGAVPVDSAEEALAMLDSIEPKVRQHFEVKYFDNGVFTNGHDSKPTEEETYDLELEKLSCQMNAVYYDPQDSINKNIENIIVKINYSCYNLNSQKAHFSVTD